nr:hypothetical protein BaRGS_004175 [Batillaria attramentaria]
MVEKWKHVQTAIVKLFQHKPLQENELGMLQENVRSSFCLPVSVRPLDQLLKKGMVILREKIKNEQGAELMEMLGDTWDYFFTEILPTLQAIMYPLALQGFDIRSTTLLEFRNIVVLKVSLREALDAKKYEVPPNIRQMLLILQFRCEKLVARVVVPYLGQRGLYEGSPEPVTRANFRPPLPKQVAKLRHLDVSHNLLKGTLAGHTFAQLRQLRWLSLQDNRLQSLQAGAMSGLGQLTFLDLSKNKLKASRHTYPLDIFDPLVSLEELLLLNIADSRLQGIVHNALFEAGSPFVQCLQEMDISGNRLFGDKVALWLALIAFKRLDRNCKDQGSPAWEDSWEFHMTPSLEYANFSSMGGRWGKLPRILKITPPSRLKVLDLSNCQISGCHTTIIGMPVLETLELSGNYCFNMTETFFDHFRSLLHIRLSNVKVNPDLFTDRAGRVFQNIQLLQTLDLSLNNLIHINPSMLHVQRHLKELNLAGNRLQSLSVDLEPHEDLVLLDLSHNMLSTLLPGERQALDALAARQNFSLRLSGNPFLCSCSNLDFVRWLWTTKVDLDGDSGGISRDYTCTTETGEVSNTLSVMAQYQVHWRLCVGQRVLPVAIAGFLLQLLLLVIVYVLSRSWTHIRYVWKVMCRLRLPRREEFRKDVYVGYADADWELACLRLPACLEERHGVRLLLRDFEEVPGSIRAENIVTHIDDSWKAQRSITDTMPDRVIVVFMEDPAHLPPMVSLERLLRMVPERNVLHVHREHAAT